MAVLEEQTKIEPQKPDMNKQVVQKIFSEPTVAFLAIGCALTNGIC